MIERIDSAVFGPVPAFIRVSVRLTGIDPDRTAASASAARAILARAALAAARAIAADDPRLIAWRAAYEDVGLGDATVSPVAALLAWAVAPGGIPTQGVVGDLVNALSLQHVVPTAAYDVAGISGDLWLRPSRGIEQHDAPRAVEGRPSVVEINELLLADSADRVVARAWHGTPGRQVVVSPQSRDVLVHLDVLLQSLTAMAPEALGAAAGQLLGGFVGARFDVRVIDRIRPLARWPA